MKKIISSILALVLLSSTMLLFAGCSAKKDVQNATNFIDDYFDDLDDEDYDDLLDMFHDDLIDDLGGEEATLDILTLRRKTAGDIDEYDIEATNYERKNGRTLVTFEIETSYERENNVDEEFSVLVDDDELTLFSIDLDNLEIDKEILNDFIKAYQSDDASEILKYIMPIYFDYTSEEDLLNILNTVKGYAGDYTGYSIIDKKKLLTDIDGKAFALFECNLLMEHTDLDMIVSLQFCEQNNELGINSLRQTPAPCTNVSNAYFNAINEGDINKVMDLYNLEIFENIEGGAAAWQEYLINLLNEAGDLQQYETTQWYMDEVMMESGLNEEVIIVKNYAIYSNGEILDTIGISFKNGVYEILYHYIEPVQ